MAKKKIIIGLSTAGSRVKLAMKNGEGKFRSVSVKKFNQEEILFKTIEKLLSFEKAVIKDIGGICVIKGPGRFTGIRISLTFASIMKVLNDVKVFAVTAFEVFAFQARENAGFKKWAALAKNPKIAVILHAFKKEYFLEVFKSNKTGIPESLGNPEWLTEDELKKRLADIKGDVFVIADIEGDNDIYRFASKKSERAQMKISKILPENIIKAGLIKKDEDISPLYLKPARYEMIGKQRGS